MTAADLNRDYYEHAQPGRDDYWRHMAAPRARMDTIVRELVRAGAVSVVDLGCGNGAALDAIRARLPAAQCAGIDLSESQIEANRRRDASTMWLSANLDGPVTLPADWRARFDAVVAMEVIEHLDAPRELLATARALAATGRGRLVLSTQSGLVRETERRVGHRRHWTTDEMRAALAETGWTVERVWNAGWPFHDWSKWWANRDPDASMARFGGKPYGPAERAVCLALRTAFRLNSRSRGAQLYAVARVG